MRTPVTITLIIMGTLLILAPFMSDMILNAQMIDALVSRVDLNRISGPEPMGVVYRFACFVTGAAMVATAVIVSVKKPEVRTAHQPAAA